MHKKIGQARVSNQTSKNPDYHLCQQAVEVTSLVRQLVEAYKAHKFCHLVVLKKEKPIL